MSWRMRTSVNIHHVVAGGGNVNNYLEYKFCFLKSIFFFLLDRSEKKKSTSLRSVKTQNVTLANGKDI